MTNDEFLGIRHWLIDRWPSMSSLTNGQWIAYRDELERFDRRDVEAALREYGVTSPQFPPGVMTLAKLAQEITLQQIHRRALPPPTVDPAEALEVFKAQHGGLTPSQVHLRMDVLGVKA